MKYFLRTVFVLLFFSGYHTWGQEIRQSPINEVQEQVSLISLIHQLESKTSYFFYYDSLQIDSIKVKIPAQDLPLKKALEQALSNTDVHFSIDRENRVFITRKVQLITDLPTHFFENKNLPEVTTSEQALAESIEDRKKKKPAIEENKIYEIGAKQNSIKQGTAVINGYIKNLKSGEPVVNGTIFIDKLNIGATADQYGYYSLKLPTGSHVLTVQGIGMKDARYQVIVYSDGKLDIDLKEQVNTLKEVVITTRRNTTISRPQLGIERLNVATIKQVPTVFGEADVLRVVLTLPGVKTVGEASTGFNVRGGSADQNLILLNDATIFNPSHFFGMFSAFNPEVIKDIELYKSSIPAKYGGRLSSVLDVSTREGNKKEFTGSAGIGIITSRINLEGPIKKDKTSFVLGARSTYANWLLNLLPDQYKNSRASFNDGNLTISHHLNDKNDLYLTGYFSNDRFNLASDTTYQYSNRNLSLKWKHSFSKKLNGYVTMGQDGYQYSVSSTANKINAYKMAFDIKQFNFKTDYSWFLNPKHTIDFGLSSIYYQLHPGSFTPNSKESLVIRDVIPTERALESAVFLAERYNPNDRISINAGIRYSYYQYLGPQEVRQYAKGLPREEGNLIASNTVSNGVIQTYHSPDYRLSARYSLTNTFSIKAGYSSLQQYIHMLSNTTAIAPTDIWKLSDPNIKPQHGDQFSIGFYKNLSSKSIETSVEVYYKRIRDYLDYKSGAVLVLNHHIETDVINTKGKAYGLEFMIKKPEGKLNGWISYTYSRILLKMDDPTLGPIINKGNYYPANYDKPHDVTMVGNFRINHRFSLSLNVTYSTGRPITLPVGRYYYGGSERVLYSDRNAYRIPDYFRSDFSMNIEGNHKVKQWTHNSWTIGAYNLTGKKNPYSVYFVSENGVVKGYKLSIFGSIIPFINYNIRF